MTATKKEPVYKFRMGRIVGTLWYNEREDGKGRHSVQIEKLYKPNGEDGWKRTGSFSRDDLPLVAKVADHCHSWIHAIWRRQQFNCLCTACDATWSSDTLAKRCTRCGSADVRSTTETPSSNNESE